MQYGRKVLLVGHEARACWIMSALARSGAEVFAFMKQGTNHPQISSSAKEVDFGAYSNTFAITNFAKNCDVDFAIVSGEDPLFYGVADTLEKYDIPCVAPKRNPARIEWSKAWARELLRTYGIRGNPRYKIFWTLDKNEMQIFLDQIDEVVIKPDGLTGGSGVMVQGDHFQSRMQVFDICRKILRSGQPVILEEKQIGQEFTIQGFCDGNTVRVMPIVQDNKRLEVGDKGTNTGSMGAFSFANHSLPFIRDEDLAEAKGIIDLTVAAIHYETGIPFKGFLYGGFMVTPEGDKLIEFNARLGDPEAMVLDLLETDFVGICWSIILGTLLWRKIKFTPKAMVCKYLVPKAYKRNLPEGHPDLASFNAKIEVGHIGSAKINYASVDSRPDGVYTTTSRTVAVTGVGDTLAEAEEIAETGCKNIYGPLFYRPDIGTAALIDSRVRLMRKLRQKN